MSPIPISSSSSTAPPLSALSRLGSQSPNRLSDKGFHSEKSVPEMFRPEQFKTEHLQLLEFLSEPHDFDLSPQPPQSSQIQPEHFVPRHILSGDTRARGGGGASSSGGSRGSSSSSSGDSKAPVPQPKSSGPGSSSPWGKPVKQPLPVTSKPAPKPAPKSPAPALPNHKPEPPPTSQPAPHSGSKPPKPKSGAGPSIVPDVKPKTGRLPKIPKIPKQPKMPEYRPHNQLPHTSAGGGSSGHSKHGDSKKVGGCNVNCRNALLGTFGALALLGLVGVVIFCIFRRKRHCRGMNTERGRRSKTNSYSDGRRWWKQGRSSSRRSEDGMQLKTHTVGGTSFSMIPARLKTPQVHTSERITGSYDGGVPSPSEELPRHSEELSTNTYHEGTPIPFDQRWTTISYWEDMPRSSETPQMRSQEQGMGSNGEGELVSIRPDRSSDSLITARSISPYESGVLQGTRTHSREESTSSGGVPKLTSTESDESDCESPIPGVAQSARIVRQLPVILTIAGMQGFRAGHCELQRRNARRNSDRPDLSESRHQSLKSESSGTYIIGENSDEADSDDTCTVTDNDNAGTVTDDEDWRGPTGQRSSHGSARMKGKERLKRLPLEQVLKHADGRVGDRESGVRKGRGEGSPYSIVAVDFLSPDYHGTTDPGVPRCWRP